MENARERNPFRGMLRITKMMISFMGMKVIYDTASSGWQQQMQPECPTCRGCGIMTCPRCRGSGNVRSRPARLVQPDHLPPLLLQRHEESMPCFECGTRTKFDYHANAAMSGYHVFQYFLSASRESWAGLQFAHLLPPTSGTIICPDCGGARHLRPRLFQTVRPQGALARQVMQAWLPISERAAHHRSDAYTRTPLLLRQFGGRRKTHRYIEFSRHARPFTSRERNFPPIREKGAYVPDLWRDKAINVRAVNNQGFYPKRKLQLLRFRLPNLRRNTLSPQELQTRGQPFPY